MKVRVASSHDIKTIMDLAYESGQDIGREFIDKALFDYCVYYVQDDTRMLGVIIYGVSANKVKVHFLAISPHADKKEVVKRLFYTIEANEPKETIIDVHEGEVEMQILLRDSVGMKYVETNTHKGHQYYTFTKLRKEKENANV